MNVIRASELGRCVKAEVANQLGFSPMDAPEKMQAAYERGNVHEDACLAALREHGHVVVNEQQEVMLDVLDGWQVIGHLDGVDATQTFAHRVWEAKAPNAYDKFHDAYLRGDWSDPLAHRYAWQISAYMLATGLEAYVTSWDEERGVRGFGIEVPPFDLETIRARVEIIAGFVSTGVMPGVCTQNDWPCPFLYLHQNTEEVAEDSILDDLAEEYAHWADEEKRDGALKKLAQEKIREHLGGKDITTAHSKVTFFEAKAPVKYDMDRMRADGVDVDAYLIVGKPSERMKITRRGTDEQT